MTTQTHGPQRASDRLALRWYLARVRLWLAGAPRSERRRILADLRRDTTATATEIGMATTLADLGHPRELAATYLDEAGTPRPNVWARTLAVVAVVMVALATTGVLWWRQVATHPDLTTPAWGADPAFSEQAETGQMVARDATEPVYLGLELQNSGRFDVTVSAIESDATTVRFSPDDVTDDGITVRIDPAGEQLVSTTLPPGGSTVMYVWLDPGCYSATDGVVASQPWVDISVRMLGVTSTQTIDLPDRYGFTNTDMTSGDNECG